MTDRQDKPAPHRAGNVSSLVWALAGVCAVLLAMDLFVDHSAPFAIKRLFGFYGIFGFVASLVLVLLVRLAAPLSTRREDYYDR